MKWIKFLFSKVFLKQLAWAVGVMALFFALLFVYLRFTTDYNETVEVPDLSGMALTQVDRVLREQELRYEVVDSIYRENQKGTVLEQIPAFGAKVKRNRMLYLTIHSYMPPMSKMNVKTGESMRVAELKLKIAGLRYTTEYRPDVCNECVLEVFYKGQEINEGDPVREGETIQLILGEKGSRKMPAPDVSGRTLAELKGQQSKLSISIGYPFYDEDIKTRKDSLEARIYDQMPKAGSLIKAGNPVDVWLTTKPLEPDTLPLKRPK